MARVTQDIRAVSCGWNFRHPPTVVVDRPNGSGNWLLILGTTAMAFDLPTGVQIVPANQAILFAPGHPQRYGGPPGSGFGNHWLHLDGAGVAALVADLRLTTDRILPLTDPGPLLQVLHDLDAVWTRREAYHAEESDLLAARSLIVLSRCSGDQPTRHRKSTVDLHGLRQEIMATIEEPWTVSRMARRVGLSVPRFSAVYRTTFGVSPMEEVIQARIDRAVILLDSGMTVAAVAGTCGFNDLSYFHRQFLRRVGRTPGNIKRIDSHRARS